MKRSIWAILFVLCLSVIYTACMDASGSKPSTSTPTSKPETENVSISEEYVRILNEAGFTAIPLVVTAKAEHKRILYKEKYDLIYISSDELSLLTEANDLIVGPAERYIGEIPLNIAKQIATNFEKLNLSAEFTMFRAPDGRTFTTKEVSNMSSRDRDWVKTGSEPGATVFVVGPVKKFNTKGMVITERQLVTENKDPIALVKVPDGGWLELARW